MRNVQDFTDGQPIIQRLRGNPRLLEWSAELLNHLSLEQLTQLLCQPVLNLHQPMNSPAQHSSPPSSHGGMLSSSSPPLLQSGAASHRMEWIQTQPAWMQLSSEAQTLVRKLVHLLESVPSAPSSSSSSNGADASGRSNSVVSPHPGAGSPGSDRSSPPSAMVSSGSAASTYSSSQPGASMAGASPGNATVLSPTSAPVEGSHSHPNPLAYLQRTQSEPQREASPAPEHRSSEQIPTFPVPSSAESSRASEPQPPQLQPSPDSSDPARPRSPASSPTIHVSSAMSSGEDDSDSDGYDRHAAVLSPICAPHGDHLHSQARKLARHSSSADSLKLASLAKALEEEEDAQEAKQTSP